MNYPEGLNYDVWEKIVNHGSEFPTYNDNIQFDGNFSEETKHEIYQFLYDDIGRFENQCPQIKLLIYEKLYGNRMQYLFDRITQSVLFYDRQTERLCVFVEQYIPQDSVDRLGLEIVPGKRQYICNINRILISKDGYYDDNDYNIIVETDTVMGEIFPDNYQPQTMNDVFGTFTLFTDSAEVNKCTSIRHG